MTVVRTAAEVLAGHVTLEVESIDRMYLNTYVPRLQLDRGVVGFVRHRGFQFASSAVMQPITDDFVRAIRRYVDEHGLSLSPHADDLAELAGDAKQRIQRAFDTVSG